MEERTGIQECGVGRNIFLYSTGMGKKVRRATETIDIGIRTCSLYLCLAVLLCSWTLGSSLHPFWVASWVEEFFQLESLYLSREREREIRTNGRKGEAESEPLHIFLS